MMMGFIKGMKISKRSIVEIGIFKAILIIVISICIESTGFLFEICIKDLGSAVPYINFLVEILFKFLTVIIILKLFSKKSEEAFEYSKPNVKYFLFTCIIIIGFRLFYAYSIGRLVSHIEINPMIQKAFEELAESPIILIFSVSVVAPIFEEIIFRGIILNGMFRKLNSKVIAIIISSLLFALMHMNLVQGINAFLLGILLGYIYLKTKSIHLSIFAHFINNTIGIMISVYMEKLSSTNNLLFKGCITFTGAIIMTMGCLWYNKNGENLIKYFAR